jgi:nitrogen fixation-related uncharacterized protein
MIALSDQGALLAVWICFTVFALIGIIVVFGWAVRARQFSDQDRARHLPLRSNIPPAEGEGKVGNGPSGKGPSGNGPGGAGPAGKQGSGTHASV